MIMVQEDGTETMSEKVNVNYFKGFSGKDD